ncbi:hypothetical protein GCM10010174_09800 [Kutzneria viridogrisea]|uniref:Lipoprotein n=1 Tax=Kutzneria viridogrisea TaxID=47990 RepID=A0ABR6BWV5_9PSEU|nr:hypothetical protein [Kutzneria viridogrisea]
MRVGILVFATVLLLVGCSSSVPTAVPTGSKSEVCARALGSALLTQFGEDLDRKVQHAKDTAALFRQLAGQSQDLTLAKALGAVADKAAEVATRDLTQQNLTQWAKEQGERLDTLRKLCL